MTIAFFDTVAGIAGDMTLGAFLNAGLPLDQLRSDLSRLELGGYELSAHHITRNGIDATQVDVDITAPTHLHRTLATILGLIGKSTLAPGVKDRAERMFRVLAEAEARVHGTTVDRVHFHEVGAVDSIVDIVGVAVCLEHFGIERVYSTPVPLGSAGTVRTQHGILPIPAPATLELLRDYPVMFTSIPNELTTPTGAAILKAFSSGVLDSEQIRVTHVGYGAGTQEIAQIPNVLRVAVGTLPPETERDQLVLVETNIDDMNPQLYPVVIEQLLAAGANDAYLVPIVMKKGRPGVLLSVLVERTALDGVSSILARETTTIGFRIRDIGRRKLPRRLLELPTRFGTVRVKAVVRDGREIRSPEFEECRRIAAETGLPIIDVLRLLEQELNPSDPISGSTP